MSDNEDLIGAYVMFDNELCEVTGFIDRPCYILKNGSGVQHVIVFKSPQWNKEVKPVKTITGEYNEGNRYTR